MIRATDLAGRPHAWPARDVAGWQELRGATVVQLRDGAKVVVAESADEIGRRIAAEAARQAAPDARNAAPGAPGSLRGEIASGGHGRVRQRWRIE
jgi:uncharacterized protein YlzI (FlbEa/FlbD family)